MSSRSVGKFYENEVVKFLTKKGHTIIFRNFFTPYGEIDLISEFNSKVYFTEVKFLSKINKIYPIQKIDSAKIKRIYFSISYLKKFCRIKNYQVDSVCTYFKDKKLTFEYYPDLRIN